MLLATQKGGIFDRPHRGNFKPALTEPPVCPFTKCYYFCSNPHFGCGLLYWGPPCLPAPGY